MLAEEPTTMGMKRAHDYWHRRPGGERAVKLSDLPEGSGERGRATASVPWDVLGIAIEKGRCRWCGAETSPRATWCRVRDESLRRWFYPCADTVFRWWSSANRLRRAVFRRDAFTCQMCGAQPTTTIAGRVVPNLSELHLDHVVPLAAGGLTTWANLQTLCARCNLQKGRKEHRNGEENQRGQVGLECSDVGLACPPRRAEAYTDAKTVRSAPPLNLSRFDCAETVWRSQAAR
jgi:hypothetical protein